MRYDKLTDDQRAQAHAAAQELDTALIAQEGNTWPAADAERSAAIANAVSHAVVVHTRFFTNLLFAQMRALDLRADLALGDLIPNDTERSACVEGMAPMRRLRDVELAFARNQQRPTGHIANAQLMADFFREILKPISTPAGPMP
jgi:hypothetical protein